MTDLTGWPMADADVEAPDDEATAATATTATTGATTTATTTVTAPPPETAPGESPVALAPADRAADAAANTADDLRVAHLLLRSGNALASRVQLETLAGRTALDVRGLLDLAESRWRTGDLGGAGEAVLAYLEAGGDDPLGYLIAAEATAAVGRPGDARRLARHALENLDLPLDTVFSGQPRSSIWPHDPAAPGQPAGTLFAPAAPDAARGGRIGLTSDARTHGPGPAAPAHTAGTTGGATTTPPWTSAQGDARQPARTEPAPPGAEAPGGIASQAPEGQPDRSLWDVATDAPMPEAQLELDAARDALATNDLRAAAMRLAIVLRVSPALAPAVLDLIGQLPGVDFDLLRGDALRLVGHEAAAERAFAAAADALRTSSTTRSPE